MLRLAIERKRQACLITPFAAPRGGGVNSGAMVRARPAAEAGGQLGIMARQIKRLVAAYRAEGTAGLVSQRLGQPSNRRLKESLGRRSVLY